MHRRRLHTAPRLTWRWLPLFLMTFAISSGLVAAPSGRIRKPELAQRHFRLAEENGGIKGGIREKYLLRDDQEQRWIFKPQAPDEAYLEEAAARLATLFGLETPEVFTVRVGEKITGSLSRMIETQGNLTGTAPSQLIPEQISQLLELEVFRWLIGDFDSHERNFLIDPEGKILTIDHGRGFRRQDFFLYDLRGEVPRDRISYFEGLWAAHAAGTVRPDFDANFAFIDRVMAAPDAAVNEIIAPLAALRVAAQGHVLANQHREVVYRTPAEFLHAFRLRRKALRSDFAAYYQRLRRYEMAGYRPPEAHPPRPRAANSALSDPVPAAPQRIQVRDDHGHLAPLRRLGRKAKMAWGTLRQAGFKGATRRWSQLAGNGLKRVGHRVGRLTYRGLTTRQVTDLDLERLPGGRKFLNRLRRTEPEVVKLLRQKLDFLFTRSDGPAATNARRLAGWIDHFHPEP